MGQAVRHRDDRHRHHRASRRDREQQHRADRHLRPAAPRRRATPTRRSCETCRERARPVVLTAVTAMLGVLPIAFGINLDFVHREIDDRRAVDAMVDPALDGDRLRPRLRDRADAGGDAGDADGPRQPRRVAAGTPEPAAGGRDAGGRDSGRDAGRGRHRALTCNRRCASRHVVSRFGLFLVRRDLEQPVCCRLGIRLTDRTSRGKSMPRASNRFRTSTLPAYCPRHMASYAGMTPPAETFPFRALWMWDWPFWTAMRRIWTERSVLP